MLSGRFIAIILLLLHSPRGAGAEERGYRAENLSYDQQPVLKTQILIPTNRNSNVFRGPTNPPTGFSTATGNGLTQKLLTPLPPAANNNSESIEFHRLDREARAEAQRLQEVRTGNGSESLSPEAKGARSYLEKAVRAGTLGSSATSQIVQAVGLVTGLHAVGEVKAQLDQAKLEGRHIDMDSPEMSKLIKEAVDHAVNQGAAGSRLWIDAVGTAATHVPTEKAAKVLAELATPQNMEKMKMGLRAGLRNPFMFAAWETTDQLTREARMKMDDADYEAAAGPTNLHILNEYRKQMGEIVLDKDSRNQWLYNSFRSKLTSGRVLTSAAALTTTQAVGITAGAAIGSAVTSGAAAGAVAGSVAPGPGTALGAAVGGAVGLGAGIAASFMIPEWVNEGVGSAAIKARQKVVEGRLNSCLSSMKVNIDSAENIVTFAWRKSTGASELKSQIRDCKSARVDLASIHFERLASDLVRMRDLEGMMKVVTEAKKTELMPKLRKAMDEYQSDFNNVAREFSQIYPNYVRGLKEVRSIARDEGFTRLLDDELTSVEEIGPLALRMSLLMNARTQDVATKDKQDYIVSLFHLNGFDEELLLEQHQKILNYKNPARAAGSSTAAAPSSATQ